jgi:hypothetical protein
VVISKVPALSGAAFDINICFEGHLVSALAAEARAAWTRQRFLEGSEISFVEPEESIGADSAPLWITRE